MGITITLLEVLVQPIRANQLEIARQYREILQNAPGLTMYDVSADIAAEAAELRAKYQIRTPDAIQLATAIIGGATHFLTNDRALKRVSEITVFAPEEIS